MRFFFFFSFLGFGFGREAVCRYRKKKEEGNMGLGFGRGGSWMVWKRKVLGLEEKTFAGTAKGRKKEEGRKENLVLTLFIWFIKLDRCQNFK